MRLTIKQEKSIEIGTAELRCNQITSEVKRIQSYAEQLSHTIHAKNERCGARDSLTSLSIRGRIKSEVFHSNLERVHR